MQLSPGAVVSIAHHHREANQARQRAGQAINAFSVAMVAAADARIARNIGGVAQAEALAGMAWDDMGEALATMRQQLELALMAATIGAELTGGNRHD